MNSYIHGSLFVVCMVSNCEISYERKQRISWTWENLEVRKPRDSPGLSERRDSSEGKKSRELEFGTLSSKAPCKTIQSFPEWGLSRFARSSSLAWQATVFRLVLHIN